MCVTNNSVEELTASRIGRTSAVSSTLIPVAEVRAVPVLTEHDAPTQDEQVRAGRRPDAALRSAPDESESDEYGEARRRSIIGRFSSYCRPFYGFHS
jgi:hypothetical protein